MNFFQTERKQEAHFDYFQCPLLADSTIHCKTIKETCLKRSNFMAQTNTELYNCTTAEACDFQSPTTRFLTLTIMQSVETYNIKNSHHNFTSIICDILRLTSILSEQPSRDGLKKQWKSQTTDSGFVKFYNQFNHNVARFRPVSSNTDTISTSKLFFSVNERCCLFAAGVQVRFNNFIPTVETELEVTECALDVHIGCAPFVKD